MAMAEVRQDIAPLYWERVDDGAIPPPAVGAELTAKIAGKRVRFGAWQWHDGKAYRAVWDSGRRR